MKIWIVGVQGLVGSTLYQLCQQRKIPCEGTSRTEADVSDLEMLRRMGEKIAPTHIVNCAAYTDVDRAESEVERTYLVNAKGAEHLGRVAKECHAALIHLSSDYVFGGDKETPYVEHDGCGPLGIYAESKLEGEKRLLEVFPKACIIRSSWLFGKKGRNFISSMVSVMQRLETVKVVSDQRGKPTYCKDLAEAILDLLCHTGIFHFANNSALSRYEMAVDICREAKALGMPLVCKEIIPVTMETFPTLAKRPHYSVLDTGKVEKILGKRPREWTSILQEYLREI